MDNFNLRKYLVENKLTSQSKLISEYSWEEWTQVIKKKIPSDGSEEDAINKVIDDLISTAKNLQDEQHPDYSDYVGKDDLRALYKALTDYLRVEYKKNGEKEKLSIAKDIFFNQIKPNFTGGGGEGSRKSDWLIGKSAPDDSWKGFLKRHPEVKDKNLAGEVYSIMQEQNGFDDFTDEEIVSFMKAAATWTDAEDVADYFDEPASDLGRLIASYYQEESGYKNKPEQWDNYLDRLFHQTERQGDDIDD